MYVYKYVYLHRRIHIHMHLYIIYDAYTPAYIFVYLGIHRFANMYIYIYIFMHVQFLFFKQHICTIYTVYINSMCIYVCMYVSNDDRACIHLAI